MTTALTLPNVEQQIADIERRLHDLEQRRALTYGTGGSSGAPIFPGGITIGDSAPIFVDEDVPAPTNIVRAGNGTGNADAGRWGAFFDNIYTDVSWMAPAGDQVVEYEVEIAKKNAGTFRYMRTAGTSVRVDGLEPSTGYTIRVRSMNRLGKPSAFVSAPASSVDATVSVVTGLDATAPAAPTGLVATPGIRSVTARWTANTEYDVAHGRGEYELQIDTVNTFNSGNLRTVRTGAVVASITDLTTGQIYYLRVRAVDASGNVSGYSSTANATPGQVANGDISANAITGEKILAGSVTAAHAIFATAAINSADINTLTAAKITSGDITAALITIKSSGALRIGRESTPFHYIIQDAAGIRFYKDGSAAFTGGTVTVDLSVATGSATFAGNIDATSGTISGVLTLGASGKLRAGPVDSNRAEITSTGFRTYGNTSNTITATPYIAYAYGDYTSTSAGTTHTFDPWAMISAATGDFVMIIFTHTGGTGTTVTPPAGWTLVVSGGHTAGVWAGVYYRIKQAGDSGNITFTLSNAQNAGAHVRWFTGVHATPLNGAATANVETNNSTATSLGITTTVPNVDLVEIHVGYPFVSTQGPLLAVGNRKYYDSFGTGPGSATGGMIQFTQEAVGATGNFSRATDPAPATATVSFLIGLRPIIEAAPIVSLDTASSGLFQGTHRGGRVERSRVTTKSATDTTESAKVELTVDGPPGSSSLPISGYLSVWSGNDKVAGGIWGSRDSATAVNSRRAMVLRSPARDIGARYSELILWGESPSGSPRQVALTTEEFRIAGRSIDILDATTVPTASITGGGRLYSESGELKWRNPAGIIRALGLPGILPNGYAGKTASQNTIADADITGLSVTVNVVAGRRYRVTGYCAALAGATFANDEFSLRIQEGAAVLQSADVRVSPTGGNLRQFAMPTYVFTAAASAARTFKLRLTRFSGGGTLNFEASATAPGFIMVEDIGV